MVNGLDFTPAATHPTRTRTFGNVQALRAVAALMVVWVHLQEMFPDSAFVSRLPSGYAGVDLFFVISGFIMVASTTSATTTAGTFIVKRYVRIAPLYYAFTALVVGIALLSPSLLKSSSSDPTDLVRSLAFIPFEKSPDRVYPTYYLGWSLNYEVFFYLVFAGAIAVRHRFRGGGGPSGEQDAGVSEAWATCLAAAWNRA